MPYFKLREHPRMCAAAATGAPGTCPTFARPISGPPGWPAAASLPLSSWAADGWCPIWTSFFQSIGQPTPSITDVSVDGTQNTPNQSGSAGEADYEVALDIQVAGAAYYAATGQAATIRVYWSQDIGTAVAKAAADGCDVCTISWGSDEAEWGTTAARADGIDGGVRRRRRHDRLCRGRRQRFERRRPDAGQRGLPLFVPACGGLRRHQQDDDGETVWNDNPGETNGEGTGGGYSTLFPVQAFQIGAPPAPANTQYGRGRMVPDVAADADPNTGYNIYVHGSATVVGGTSAVAPLYAGLVCRLRQQARLCDAHALEKPDGIQRHYGWKQRPVFASRRARPLQRHRLAYRDEDCGTVCRTLIVRSSFAG